MRKTVKRPKKGEAGKNPSSKCVSKRKT